MQRWIGTACMLGIASAVVTLPAPASAQFAGSELEQFAPMLETMKRRMGKRRYGQLMRTVGPMMADMMDNSGGGFGGFGGGYGGYGGGFAGLGSMQGMTGMMNSFDFGSMRGLIGSSRRGARRSRRAR